jgi:NADH-quinone oxidoreductase subunit C
VSYEDVPGLVSVAEAHGETTVVVERERVREAALHLRDTAGFNFLSDVTSADYLGWAGEPVAGYWGHARGRDLNAPGTGGLHRLPERKPARFSVSYHLLALCSAPKRLRLQTWLEERETVPSVVPVWPTADWAEREVYDLMGIVFDGHPNLVRILMSEDWEGYPLRKDYPMGGEPVRFSEAE